MSKLAVRLKVFSLVLTFLVVLASMHFVQKGGLLAPFQTLGLFGASRPTTDTHLNLCSTRVSQMEFANGERIFQDGRYWKISGPQERDMRGLDTVAVEKWLAQHCEITIQPTVSHGGAWSPLLTLKLVDGKDQKIETSGRFYRVGYRVFVSDDLASAVQELRDLGSH